MREALMHSSRAPLRAQLPLTSGVAAVERLITEVISSYDATCAAALCLPTAMMAGLRSRHSQLCEGVGLAKHIEAATERQGNALAAMRWPGIAGSL